MAQRRVVAAERPRCWVPGVGKVLRRDTEVEQEGYI